MRINIGSHTLLIKWGPRIEVHQSWWFGRWSVCDCRLTFDHRGKDEVR